LSRLPLADVPEVRFSEGFTEGFTEGFCASREGFCVSREGFCEFCVGSLTVPEAAPENSSWTSWTGCSSMSLISFVDIVVLGRLLQVPD